MKPWLVPLLTLGFALPLAAIPNSIGNQFLRSNSPLDGIDMTDELLDAVRSKGRIRGEWRPEGRVGGAEISYLGARPEVLGHECLLLRSFERDGELERIEATFVDAGSFFGYFDQELPEGLSARETEEEMQRRLAERQAEFLELYRDTLAGLRVAIAGRADDERPKTPRFGHVRALRLEPEEWRQGDLVMRLFAAEDRLIRVEISRGETVPVGWMDARYADETKRERAARLAASVSRDEDGAVRLEDLDPVPQGYRPYCGLNSLAIAARHFGMHLDEDWMAVAAGFRNTGSASGSNMIKLYHAVASEAGLSLDRANDFDENDVRRALESGYPVVVWRRFSFERNALHDRVARRPGAELPDPSDPAEQASWPGEDAPLHSSVICGFDPEARELLFLESWSGQDQPRRMRIEEMEATAYLCFVFGE